MSNGIIGGNQRRERGENLKKFIGEKISVEIFSSSIRMGNLAGILTRLRKGGREGYFIGNLQIPINYSRINPQSNEIEFLIEITNPRYKFPILRRVN